MTISSCKKFIDIRPSSSQIISSIVFENDQTATAALLNIYTGLMQNESWNMSQSCGLLSDELNGSFSMDPGIIQSYKNAMDPGRSPGPWTTAYTYIYQSNAIVEGLQGSTGTTPTIRQKLIGESKFIRAFWYFYLINCYGDVPLVTSTDYKVNGSAPRTEKGKVYEQVVSDLEASKELLNSNFVDGTDTSITTERVRPTSWAAMAMLARVYLYTKKYDSAFFYASAVINNSSLFQLTDSLNDVFLRNSTEAIWQLGLPDPTNINTFDGYAFILTTEPSIGSANTVTISNNLLNSFEANDQRRIHWIGSYLATDGSGTIYNFPFKYKINTSSDPIEYTMMLRLAEQYLIRAEARAQINDLAGAVTDLNRIRYRAGLPDYNGVLDKPSVLSAILHERRVELMAEWGHRWFDLIRTENVDTVMFSIASEKGNVWNSTAQLFPIPQSERSANTHLTQNEGY